MNIFPRKRWMPGLVIASLLVTLFPAAHQTDIVQAASSVASTRIHTINHATGSIKFDPNFGGSIVSATKNGNELVDNVDYGRLWQMALGIENDPTQASSNGIQQNRIYVPGQEFSQIYQYYGQELVASTTQYKVRLKAPLWISTTNQLGDQELRWTGNFTNPSFHVFKSAGHTTVWPQNVQNGTNYQFYGGRVAAKINVKITSDGGNATNWSGLQFRQSNATDSVSNSGYLALLRANGTLQLLKGATLLGSYNLGKSAVNTDYQLEVRTEGSNLQVWLDDVKRIEVNDSTYSGNYAAFANFGTDVTWQNIAFYDTGIELEWTVTYNAATNRFTMNSKVYNLSSVARPIQGDFVQLPVFFMNRPSDASLNDIYYRTTATGSWTKYLGADRHWGVSPSSSNYAYELLIGNDDPVNGYALVLRTTATGATDQYRLFNQTGSNIFGIAMQKDVDAGTYEAVLGASASPARDITTEFYIH
ncbi:MAG: hypothetical protein ACE3L7_14235 [Candidatus Pristimantibacillus sp.]